MEMVSHPWPFRTMRGTVDLVTLPGNSVVIAVFASGETEGRLLGAAPRDDEALLTVPGEADMVCR